MMDLNRATTFVKVVEAGGFTRAAELIGLPPSSVSRSVSKLEHELGVTLLERTTRKIALTEAGRAYFERAREALAGLEEANSLALDAAQEVHGVVRVALPLELGASSGLLVAGFLATHPRIRVEITFTNRGAELLGDLVDLAVVLGSLPDSSLISRRLGSATQRLYAAPSYIEQRGKPRSIADLAKHDGVLVRAVAGSGRWDLRGPSGIERVDMPARVVADHQQFQIDAAIAGLGIALLSSWIGDRAVREGTLVPILPKYSSESTMHVLTNSARHLPRRVALVRDYLVETLAGQCRAHHKIA
jgi:DNA-binding transcriptional LysR family regulator